jgi:hypothetical protein
LHERNVVASAADSALVELSNAFTDATDDALFPFANATNGNPNYQFNYNERSGYVGYIGTNMFNKMQTNSDPRLYLWIDTTIGDLYPTSPNNIIGPIFGGATSPVYFITFTEQKFIEAELNYIKGNIATAIQADSIAIQASFDMAGISGDAAAYIATHPCATSGPNILRDIMYEKYIALFTHPEIWSDYRRTGYPTLTPTIGASIPRKFLYPQSEYFYNASNIPSGSTMFSKVWWDN